MQNLMYSGRAVSAAVFSAAHRTGNGGRRTGTGKEFIFVAASVTGIS